MTSSTDTATDRPATRLRSTRQGAAIDQVLSAADGFTTAHELYDELRRRGDRVGMTTVYRQLKLLADSGVLDVVSRPDGEAGYRLCGPSSATDTATHHHHVVCQICGYTVEVEGPEVEAWADRVASEAGFTNVTHTLEIFGECGRHTRGEQRRQP